MTTARQIWRQNIKDNASWEPTYVVKHENTVDFDNKAILEMAKRQENAKNLALVRSRRR